MITTDKLKIEQIINSFYSSNTYILHHVFYRTAWIIDCGDSESIINYLKKENLTIAGILLTHAHFDHIYGLNELLKYASNFTIYTSENGFNNLFNPKLNLSKYHNQNFIYSGNNISIVNDNDMVKLYPDIYTHCKYTQGHDWSCITYNIGNLWFTGDSFLPGIKTMANFPKSDKISAKQSEEMIISKLNKSSIICPGHGDIILNNNLSHYINI